MTYCLSPLDSWIAVSGTGEFFEYHRRLATTPQHATRTCTYKKKEERRREEAKNEGRRRKKRAE